MTIMYNRLPNRVQKKNSHASIISNSALREIRISFSNNSGVVTARPEAKKYTLTATRSDKLACG